jgi:hypothetical protein
LAFEDNMLVGKTGMLLEVRAEARFIARVDEVEGAAKDGVFDAFMVRQVQTIGGDWLLNASLEAGPTGEAAFAGDGELRTAEFELGGKDGLVQDAREVWMELADELRRCNAAGSMGA